MRQILIVTALSLVAALAAATESSTRPAAGLGQMPTLPSGHPAIVQGSGVIVVEVVQGTEGGPAITGGAVTVELYASEQKIRDIPMELDSHGVVLVEDLPLMMPPLRPRATVDYGGAVYEAQGEPMVAAGAQQKITVTVYETSEQVPPWEILGWQIIAKPSPEGLQVVEMVSVTNPSDWAYLAAPDADGARRALVWTVPADSIKVWVGGDMHDCCTQRMGAQLISTKPLKPGRSVFHVGYTLPTPDGEAALALTVPAHEQSLRIFLPHELDKVRSADLIPGEIHKVYGQLMRRYDAADIHSGGNVTLTVTGLPKTASATKSISAQGLIRMGAISGVGLCLLVGIVILFRKPTKQSESAA